MVAKRRKRRIRWLRCNNSPRPTFHPCNRPGLQWHAKTQTCNKTLSSNRLAKSAVLPLEQTSYSSTLKCEMKQNSLHKSISMSKWAIWPNSLARKPWKRELRPKRKRMAEMLAHARPYASWGQRSWWPSPSKWLKKRPTVSLSKNRTIKNILKRNSNNDMNPYCVKLTRCSPIWWLQA